MSFEEIREDVQARRKLTYLHGKPGLQGCYAIEAYHDDMPVPIATVWYAFFGLTGIQTLNSYVWEQLRRCGLRTYLHEKLLAAYPKHTLVISGAGTREGKAWMKSAGFKKTANGWEFRRSSRRQSSNGS